MTTFINRTMAWAALASGLAAVLQLIFIIIFYSGVGIFDPINDIAYSLQIVFTLPLVFLLQRSIATHNRLVSYGITALGILACVVILTLQLLLIFGKIPFTSQIGPLLLAVLILLAWFVLAEQFAADDSVLPKGTLLAVLAGLSFGYPVWAYRLRKKLDLENHGQSIIKEESSP